MGVRTMPYAEADGKPQFAGLNSGGSGGGHYTLPTATSSELGGVKIGEGVNVTSDGTISVDSGGGFTLTDEETVVGYIGSSPLYCKSYTGKSLKCNTNYNIDNDFPYNPLIGFYMANESVGRESFSLMCQLHRTNQNHLEYYIPYSSVVDTPYSNSKLYVLYLK